MNMTHDQLVNYIKENTLTVLGEEIRLAASKIKGADWILFSSLTAGYALGEDTILIL